jgi:hypothetical protein
MPNYFAFSGKAQTPTDTTGGGGGGSSDWPTATDKLTMGVGSAPGDTGDPEPPEETGGMGDGPNIGTNTAGVTGSLAFTLGGIQPGGGGGGGGVTNTNSASSGPGLTTGTGTGGGGGGGGGVTNTASRTEETGTFIIIWA